MASKLMASEQPAASSKQRDVRHQIVGSGGRLSSAARLLAAGCWLAFIGACGFLPHHGTPSAEVDSLVAAPKPRPVSEVFAGCRPEGSGDHALNVLKNRVDEGEYRPVAWRTIARLDYPATTGYRFRSLWTRGERRAVRRYEGAAVAVEGYIATSRLEIPEPTNCWSRRDSLRDIHVWLSEEAHGGARRSIVTEITPRLRARHPAWTLARLDTLRRTQQRVRVSGWLMLDALHPELVGIRRVTLWEVHPIMRIEVQDSTGGWVVLDSLARTP